ncbi:hypothetical protein HYC85_007721 [Camellia sinensis]|uniref:non-specific serine/threonine protein kinase n=1 Tax=Camellia sinensis TaxID=4442 RepID=A0A7J7HQK8_CAMSI|nr:hypothetical protein HYC85_007721 [Camellia sinensis]
MGMQSFFVETITMQSLFFSPFFHNLPCPSPKGSIIGEAVGFVRVLCSRSLQKTPLKCLPQMRIKTQGLHLRHHLIQRRHRHSSSESPPPPSSSSSRPPSSSKSPPPPLSSSSPPPPSKDDSQSQSPPPPSSKKSPPPPSSSNSKSSPPPPPPPPLDSSRNSSPPPPLSHRSSPSSKSGSSSSSSDQEALIAGVAAGVGLLVIIMIVLLCRCCKKKKRKPHDQMPYYNHNSLGNRNGDYYNGGKNHTNWNNTGNVDPSIQMPLPPSSATSQQWSAVPPLPPPQMHNNEMMSTMGFSSGPHQASLPPPHPSLALGFNKSTFTYEELATATGGFAKENLLGQGGFGYVHKGVLPNGIQIAVKSLKAGSGQGEREFQAEVDIISRVHHRHLVSLVGYCIADAQRMLVYEFVPNDSLEFHLYGEGRTPMDFPTRLKIALGSAKGFAYLHEDCHPRIIHRDIKAANILIDEHFDAKVADFGLAKLSSDNYTHVSTRIMGTFGYLAPEYASSGKLTEKSDVYSYGVVTLGTHYRTTSLLISAMMMIA